MICKPLSNKTSDLGGPKVVFLKPFVKSLLCSAVLLCHRNLQLCLGRMNICTFTTQALLLYSFTKWELNSESGALLVLVPCFCAGSDDFLQQFDTADIASAVAAATGQHAWGLSFCFGGNQVKLCEDLCLESFRMNLHYHLQVMSQRRRDYRIHNMCVRIRIVIDIIYIYIWNVHGCIVVYL